MAKKTNSAKASLLVNGMDAATHHILLMDRIYRYQRYIYDLSRKYYLLGRDSLLQEMNPKPGDRVLEIGCGTARNLILMGKMVPGVLLYGFDASHEMLKTAQTKVDSARLNQQIILRHALAEQFDYRATFNLHEPFDAIFFSYSLSMIPKWREALQRAWDNLHPGGSLYIVDFWDQAQLPVISQIIIKNWLDLFHVRHEPQLIEEILSFQSQCSEPIQIHSIFGRYAFRTNLKKDIKY